MPKNKKENEEPKQAKPEPNTAIVYRGKHEERRYELEVHGEEFVELAQQFAEKNGWEVEVKHLNKEKIQCPHCGKSFVYSKAN